MARPKPTIILEHTDQKTFRSEEVLKAEAIYAVFYDGSPISIRSFNSLVNYPGPKYKKVSFPIVTFFDSKVLFLCVLLPTIHLF